jgi:ion channel POLLUX/CASTOR
MNPPDDMVYNKGDEILVLAEDDDSYEPNDGSYSLAAGECPDDAEECPVPYGEYRPPEKILFCGWRRDMSDLISQLDEFVPSGSELWLFNTLPANQRQERLLDGGNKAKLQLENLTIKNAVGNSIIRRDLNNIVDVDCYSIPTGNTITLADFDSMLILSDETAMKNGEKGSTSSDSRSLASVLIIQDMMDKMYREKKKYSPNPESVKEPCIPVSEILDSRTKSLLSVANCKGYVMSNQIVSSVVAQVAEEKDINVVLTELFSSDGSETYVRPVEKFVDLSEEDTWSFWDVALKARQKGEVAVGYKPAELDYFEAEELIVNPPDKAEKRKWSPGDKIITFSLED